MRKQITKETMLKAVLGAIMQDPETMQQMVSAAMGKPQQSQRSKVEGQGQGQGQPTPEQMAQMMAEQGQSQPQPAQSQPAMPQGMTPEMMQQMMGATPPRPSPNGSQFGEGGMPQTDPMIPPQERM
jgi:hypothetical protein